MSNLFFVRWLGDSALGKGLRVAAIWNMGALLMRAPCLSNFVFAEHKYIGVSVMSESLEFVPQGFNVKAVLVANSG